MIRACFSALLTLGLLSGLPAVGADAQCSEVALHNPGVYPIFHRAPINAAFALRMKCQGQGSVPVPESISLRVSDANSVECIRLRATGNAGEQFSNDAVLAEGKPDAKGVVKLRPTGTAAPAAAAENWLWFDVQPAPSAPVGGLITFSDVEVTMDGSKVELAANEAITQRVGYMVAVPGEKVGNQAEDAEPRECLAFRIPGLIRTKSGALVGCFDARYTHERDLCADIDVAVVRSTDGGQTWSAPAVGMDAGPGAANGCGDPCIVQDKKGRIWMQALACHFAGGASLWTSKTGFDPASTGQWEMVYSEDDGQTWSREHINPTKQIKQDKWTTILAGPGNGIVLKDGTIVFPAQIWERGAKPQCMSTICYSKDGGKNWVYGKGVPHATSECQVVELEDGAIMINCRNEARQGKRIVYVTRDLGESWEAHETNNSALREPTCQASLIRFKTKKHNLLLFSNPNSGARNNMTIRYSEDEGKTWSEGYLYDSRNCMGYSSLVKIDSKTVGVFYETCIRRPGRSERGICFLRFPLESIMTGENLPAKSAASDKKGKKSKKRKKTVK